MAIGSFPDTERPKVEIVQGRIIIWDEDFENPNGVEFSAVAGIDVGIECLTASHRLLDQPIRPLQTRFSVEDSIERDEDCAARIVFEIEGAPFESRLTATQVVELAATFSRIADQYA